MWLEWLIWLKKGYSIKFLPIQPNLPKKAFLLKFASLVPVNYIELRVLLTLEKICFLNKKKNIMILAVLRYHKNFLFSQSSGL